MFIGGRVNAFRLFARRRTHDPVVFPGEADLRDRRTFFLEATMPLGMPPQFEADVAALVGITGYDPGSMDITLLNADGPTTVRFTFVANVDTAELKTIAQKYLQ